MPMQTRSLRLLAAFLALALAVMGCKLVTQGRATAQVPLRPTSAASEAAPLIDPTIVAPATAASILLTQQAPAAPAAPAAPPAMGAPAADAPPAPEPTATRPPFTPSPQSIARQKDVFEQIWNTVNKHYLYLDFNGLDWNQVRQDETAKIDAGMSDDEFYADMFDLIRNLGDEHSTFFSPQAAAEEDEVFEGQYNYAGVGLLTTVVTTTKSLSVLLVFPNSPAEEGGIKMHDRILRADGNELVDDQGLRIYDLRGPVGSSVTLEVETPGQPPRSLTITRRQINSSMPVPHQVLRTPGGKRIGYIFIPTFNDKTIGESIGAALQDMAQGGRLDGFIIDNRYNSGGASTVMLNTLSYFADGKVGYFIERKQKTPLEVQGSDIGGSQTAPLVVMVGGGSASFGEIFSGILKDLGRATLVGTTTDGNVEILTIFNFSDGSRAWIATSTFGPLNNRQANWEDTGIIPDITAPSEWDQVTLETDPAVLAALANLDR